MRKQVEQLVKENWHSRSPRLRQDVLSTLGALTDILKVHDHFQGDRADESHIKDSFGSFDFNMFNTQDLAKTYDQVDNRSTIPTDRFERMRSLKEKLQTVQSELAKAPFECQFYNFSKSNEEVFAAFEKSAKQVSQVVELLRKARLEMKAQFEPDFHDKFFEKFDWRYFKNEEMDYLPPFFVFGDQKGESSSLLGRILEITTTGKPIKLCILNKQIESKKLEVGRASSEKSDINLGLMALAQRNTFVLQSPDLEGDEIETYFNEGINCPRPGLFSFYDAANADLQQMAKVSRSFPLYAFCPDKTDHFVSGLNLDHNPDAKNIWSSHKIDYLSMEGKPVQMIFPPTFADFALASGSYKDQFELLDDDLVESAQILLAEYLAKSNLERRNLVPFVYGVDKNKQLRKYRPSKSILAMTVSKMKAWQALQEVAGIGNPFVKAAVSSTKKQMEEKQKAALESQREEMEKTLLDREQKAVNTAMRNVALQLTGLEELGDLSGMNLSSSSSSPASSTPAASKAPVPAEEPVSDELWIETALCTTCDECTSINKNIFVYNSDKKAIVKDPKGGPYKDIVKAAEKCSARIIHPGAPHDPNEKGLDKLIKRAEKYQ